LVRQKEEKKVPGKFSEKESARQNWALSLRGKEAEGNQGGDEKAGSWR
jgi:hypothetical protein